MVDRTAAQQRLADLEREHGITGTAMATLADLFFGQGFEEGVKAARKADAIDTSAGRVEKQSLNRHDEFQALSEERDVLHLILQNFLNASGRQDGFWQVLRVPRMVWMHANETEAILARRAAAPKAGND